MRLTAPAARGLSWLKDDFMPKKKTKSKPRRKARKTKESKVLNDRLTERWMLAIAALIVLAVIVASSLQPGITEIYQNSNERQVENPTEIRISVYSCKSNLECFLASCKITPSDEECVNVAGQENFYQNCQAYWDVDIVQDFTKCACVQNVCKLIK